MHAKKNILLLILVALTVPLFAQNNCSLAPGYSIVINGGSNLHDWSEKVGQATGSGTVSPVNNGLDLNSLEVIIQAKSITSGEGSVMNNKTYNALKTSKYPEIRFTLTAPVKAIPATSNGYAVSAAGNLSIAGVTRPVMLSAKISVTGQKTIMIEGDQKISMSNFGITPPTALFGMLKVSNDVTIHYKISLTY